MGQLQNPEHPGSSRDGTTHKLFPSLAPLSFNSNRFREKAILPQLLLSQHLLWQAIIRAIEVSLSLFILLKCYNRSNNTFMFALFFLSTRFKIL